MAGNNSIQVLRGSRDKISQSNQQLLDGQLLYNTTDNYLTVGGGADGNSVSKLPIVCREIKGYAEDSENISSANTTKYSIEYKKGKGLFIKNNVVVNDNTLVSQHSDGTTTSLYGVLIPSCEPNDVGIQSVAFGGSCYRKIESTEQSPTSAKGMQAMAFGGSCYANGDFSFAGGKHNETYQGCSVALGGGNKVGLTEEEFNNNYPSKVDSQGYNYRNSYNWSFACGTANEVKSKCSFVTGNTNTLDFGADETLVSGYGNKVQANKSIVVGIYNKEISGNRVVALGQGNKLDASDTIIVGAENVMQSKGTRCGLFGWKNENQSSGWSNFILGSANKNQSLSSNNMFICGQSNTASAGTVSFISGYGNKVSGNYSFTSASTSINSHNFTAVFGESTITGRNNQLVIGRANKTESDALFVIGWADWKNSYTESDRKTVFKVHANGKAYSPTLTAQDIKEGTQYTNKYYVDAEVAAEASIREAEDANIQSQINGMDHTSSGATNRTLTKIVQKDGKITAATYENISISRNQLNDTTFTFNTNLKTLTIELK